jgi:hypothetical protein
MPTAPTPAPTATATTTATATATATATQPEPTQAEATAAMQEPATAPRAVVDYRNQDELIVRALETCKDAHRVGESVGLGYAWNQDYETPVLFRKATNRLFVAFGGHVSLSHCLQKEQITEGTHTETIQASEMQELAHRVSSYRNLTQAMPDQFAAARMNSAFLQMLDEMYDSIRQDINAYEGLSEVVLCGHGFGGALASMFLYIYTHDVRPGNQSIGQCVTFGSPRFLFADDLELYNLDCSNVIRCFIVGDPLPYFPLRSPLLEGSLASGYAHVGKALCFDSPIQHNNINEYIIGLLRGSEPQLVTAMGRVRSLPPVVMLDTLLDPAFQALLVNANAMCMRNVSFVKGVTVDALSALVKQTFVRMQGVEGYEAKCDEAAWMGLADTLKEQPFGEGSMADWGLLSRMMVAVLGNRTGNIYHQLETYDILLDALRAKEIEEGETLEAAITDVAAAEAAVVEAQATAY